MGKIKLNLVSGAIVEKPLICAFKANNMSYVILDNEMNGSMGLPIILVCKLDNNKLIKIEDQNEWQIVKEYLKNIIAGSKVELIKMASELAADDIYYTQLTLPLPSFDALKNAYTITDDSAGPSSGDVPVAETPSVTPTPAAPVTPEVTPAASVAETPAPTEPATPVVDTPVAPVTPEVTPTPAPAAPTTPVTPATPDTAAPVIDLNSQIPTFGGETPVMPTAETPAPAQSAPAVEVPFSSVTPAAPVTPEVTPVAPVVDTPVAPVTPEVTPAPTAPDLATANDDSVFKAQKEAFMQACENMFDALVQKFERELEKK